MQSLPVHWSEGLFLQPHHFQAADRAWTETLQTSEGWDHHYNYGVRRLEFSHEAIANSQFEVKVCHARMKDGTLVAVDPGQEMDRLDLKEAFARDSVVRVYLAVPKLKMGVTNVRASGQTTPSRFVEVLQSVQDESVGGNDQELRFRMLDLRLLLSTQDLAGYEVLPLAQIQRAAEQEAVPCLDGTYFPPMLSVDAWPPLGRDIVRAIYDILGKKIEVLSEQVVNRGITLVSQEPGDLDRLFLLNELNTTYAVLKVLAFASGIHPLNAYAELCRLVGRLSIFSEERRCPDLPFYDHDDLATIFLKIKKWIELLLGRIRDYEYEQRFFRGEGKGMRVTLESKWLGADWQWFIGVQHGNVSEADCLALLTPAADGKPAPLNWKLGSSRQVDALFQFGAEGLHLKPLRQAPRALPQRRDWLYFEVNRDNAAWRDVLETQTLAMRLTDNLIVNRQQLQGERNIVLALAGKQFSLQFALFAVPQLGSAK